MLPDKRNAICTGRLETKAAVDSKQNCSALQHFIALREKCASNNAAIHCRWAPPIEVATLAFTEAEKLFLAHPWSLYIKQYFVCDHFNLVDMLGVYSGIDSVSNIQMPLSERACKYLL